MLDLSCTKWVARIDGLDLFNYEFVSIVKNLSFFAYIQSQN